MENNLHISASPHIHSGRSTTSIMRDVLIALAPAAIAGTVIFGLRSLLVIAVCGILAGYLCDAYYARHFFPALVMSLCALILHQSAAFLFKFYLNGMEPALWRWLPAQIGLSLIACPVLYLPCKLIRKAGGD